MQTQQLNRTDPEIIWGSYTNGEGASLPADAVVALDNSTTGNGNLIVQPNTGGLDLVIGVLMASVASGTTNWARVQVYGYRASSILLRTDTSQQTGIKLIPVAGQNYLSSLAAGDGRDGLFALMASDVSSAASATVSRAIFIRCL